VGEFKKRKKRKRKKKWVMRIEKKKMKNVILMIVKNRMWMNLKREVKKIYEKMKRRKTEKERYF
jgi:hypothetical protein